MAGRLGFTAGGRIGQAGAIGALALLLLALAPAATAEHRPVDPPPPPERYILTGLHYIAPDNARGVDYGYGAHYGFGGRFLQTRMWELRFSASTLETGIAGATDYYQFGGGLDLIQPFGDVSRGHAYALLGVGGVSNDVVPDARDEFSAYGNAAFGWRSAMWPRWGVRHRLEARVVHDTFDTGATDILVGFALEIGPERIKVVEKLVEVEKVVEVERIVEVEKIVEVPAAPPPDGDGDGVPDARDKCPDTVAGASVEPDGCVRKEQVVVLPNIEFEFASHVLTARGREQLGGVVRFLKDQGEIELDVWGHTDAQGEASYNQRLSERRAASVRQYLIDSGIEAGRLKSAGFGESRPLVAGTGLEAYARNRRVELNIRAAGGAGGG